MKTKILGIVALTTFASLQCGVAQVILNETFDYANLTALQAQWGSTAGLGLDLSSGNAAPSATHSGANTVHLWAGNTTLSLKPTDANPIVLSADIYDSGAGNQRNTVGLRSGASPLFEMGMYNAFTDPSSGSGEGVRVLNFAGSQGWHQMGAFTTGWSHWEATFTTYSVTVRVDTGIDGSWDLSWTSTGTTATGTFTDLRFGGPSGVTSAGGGFAVDNIRLQVIPEPSTIALGGVGLLGLMAWIRGRRTA